MFDFCPPPWGHVGQGGGKEAPHIKHFLDMKSSHQMEPAYKISAFKFKNCRFYKHKTENSEVDRYARAARARGAHPADDKTHHGTLTVEGVVVDDVLVLLDRKSGAVYDGAPSGPQHIYSLQVPTENMLSRSCRE